MVSAKTGVAPMLASKRTADAAPVTTLTPPIPSNPFMTPSRLGSTVRVICFDLSRFPASPYSAQQSDGTHRGLIAVETLEMGHLSHTSDLRPVLLAVAL